MNSFRICVICLVASQVTVAQIRISADTAQGRVDCGSPRLLDLTGSVLETGKDSFALDLCLPTEDCSAPIRAGFFVSAPGFVGFGPYLRRSAFIRVKLEMEVRGGRCLQRISVSSVATWKGDRNPSGRPDEFYFMAGEGSTQPLEAVPFQLRKCPKGEATLGFRVAKQEAVLTAGSLWTQRGWTASLVTAGRCASDERWSYWVAAPL